MKIIKKLSKIIERWLADCCFIVMHNKRVIGRYITEFDNTKLSRCHNISLAAYCINMKTVQPDGIFSFDQIVGPRNYERGFIDSRGLSNGKAVRTVGGGICQVSSTLCAAVQLAGLEIVERHQHSSKVAYCPSEFEAAISAGANKDFKFKNNRGVPVWIQCEVFMKTGQVEVSILM